MELYYDTAMKTFSVLLGLLLLSSTALHARSYGKAKEVHLGETSREIDKKISKLHKRLSLSPEQLHRAQNALEEQRLKLDSLDKEIADARRKIIEDTDGVMRSVLNPEQQEKYAGFKEEIIGKAETTPPTGNVANE